MDINDMDLSQYCALNRARFYVDATEDAAWYFGSGEVESELLRRVRSDLDVRGVPKCGVVGRFGIGKTHTLNHLKWLFESSNDLYPLRAFKMDIVWDENNRELNSWRTIHTRMLDAMGEPFLRELVRTFDAGPASKQGELTTEIQNTFRFGDENLQRSLAIILSDYYRREVRSSVAALQWLKGDRAGKADALGVPKTITDAGDMVFTILNLGSLYRAATKQGLVFLMDEAQHLGDVRKAASEVHRAFLKFAEPDNRDVGFVLAAFGGGVAQVPQVLTTPEDIISRLGVTRTNLNDAFIELQRVLRTQADIRSFIDEVIGHLSDTEAGKELIDRFELKGVVPGQVPFTNDSLERIAKVIFNTEQNRNPRIIIDTMARACSVAYRQAKDTGKYQLVDVGIVDSVVAGM